MRLEAWPSHRTSRGSHGRLTSGAHVAGTQRITPAVQEAHQDRAFWRGVEGRAQCAQGTIQVGPQAGALIARQKSIREVAQWREPPTSVRFQQSQRSPPRSERGIEIRGRTIELIAVQQCRAQFAQQRGSVRTAARKEAAGGFQCFDCEIEIRSFAEQLVCAGQDAAGRREDGRTDSAGSSPRTHPGNEFRGDIPGPSHRTDVSRGRVGPRRRDDRPVRLGPNLGNVVRLGRHLAEHALGAFLTAPTQKPVVLDEVFGLAPLRRRRGRSREFRDDYGCPVGQKLGMLLQDAPRRGPGGASTNARKVVSSELRNFAPAAACRFILPRAVPLRLLTAEYHQDAKHTRAEWVARGIYAAITSAHGPRRSLAGTAPSRARRRPPCGPPRSPPDSAGRRAPSLSLSRADGAREALAVSQVGREPQK